MGPYHSHKARSPAVHVTGVELQRVGPTRGGHRRQSAAGAISHAKAIVRSKLWDPSIQIKRSKLPTAGKMLAEISGGKVDGDQHDRMAPERMKATIY